MGKVRVFIYSRQSKGSETESVSIAVQEEKCREFAAAHHLEVVDVFSDPNTNGHVYPTGFESQSLSDSALQKWLRGSVGEKKVRRGLGELFGRLSEVGGVVVIDLTRFYRPLSHSNLANEMNFRMEEAHVKLYSVKEGEIDFGRPTDQLITNLNSQVSHMQMSFTHDKASASMHRIRDDGYIPTAPRMFGIKYIGGKDRLVEVIPECAEAIRYVFDGILRFTPYNQILRGLNERYSHLVGGKAFYDSSWRHIVAQPFYCGYMYDSKGDLIRAKQMIGKEIVTLQEWNAAMALVNSPKRVVSHDKSLVHPFSGILVCGHCGSKLVTGVDHGKEYYHCVTGRGKGSEECKGSRLNVNLNWRTDLFTGLREAMCPFLILGLYHKLNEQDSVLKSMDRIAELKADLQNCGRRYDELGAAYAADRLNLGAFTVASKNLDLRMSRIKAQILRMEDIAGNAKVNEEKIRKFFEELDRLMNNELDDVTYKELLRMSVTRIKSFREHIVIESVYGDVDLPRRMHKCHRNFPRFTYVRHPLKDFVQNFRSSRIEVLYHYGDDTPKKLIADFSVMKIYVKS